MEELIKKFKKFGTAQVIAQLKKATGDTRTACIEILKQRNQDVSEWEVEAEVKTETKEEIVVFEDETPLTEKEKEVLDTFEAEEKLEPIELIPAVKVVETDKPSVQKEKVLEVIENASFKKGDTVTFTSAKNSKKAPNIELTGEVISVKTDKNKFWLTIKVKDLGLFLKESSKCS